MQIPETLLVTPEQVYEILTRHKISLKEAVPVASAMMEILTESSKLIEAEVEKRLNALAPPGTVPQVLQVRLEFDTNMAAASAVDFESYQKARAAHMLAVELLKHLPLSKRPIETPQMMGRQLELWTWETVIFVKPEKSHEQANTD